MKRIACTLLPALSAWFCLAPLATASSDPREIDSAIPRLRFVFTRAASFQPSDTITRFRHRFDRGQVKESGDISVVLRVDARKLRVVDPEASESTRTQIQDAMLGPQVLDATRFSEIRFQSTAIEPRGPAHWMVHGNLTLHGTERHITFEVILKEDHYRGSVPLKQTDFEMKPVAIAGGTVKVKDEVKIEFDIALMK